MIRIWDIWIRLFHWSLVISVGFLLFSGETGIGFFDWHKPVGEFVFALLLFRILWSVAGSSNASLIALFRPPVLAFQHLKALFKGRVEQERGHNAAGGWSVLALILILAVQATTGLFIADEEELIEGVFYGSASSSLTDFFYTVHHTNAQFIQILITVHVIAVLLYWFLAKQNLIKAMITGKLAWSEKEPVPPVSFRHSATGFLLAIGVALLVYWLFGYLPF